MDIVTYICCDKQRIELDAIVWLEGDWNYTRIYQLNKPVSLSAYTLKRYERQLAGFVRIRKDAIVNPLYICAMLKISSRPRRLKIVLTNGEQLEVTRRRQAIVRIQLATILNALPAIS